MYATITGITADPESAVNPEFRDAISKINADYRARVALRAKQREEREQRWKMFRQINEVVQAYVCAGFIFLTWMFFAENAAQMTWPTQGIICTVYFLIAQACGWGYIAWVIRKYGAGFFS